jgi:CRP/FNR family transcriptional regulator, anaerobic regulatory protein
MEEILKNKLMERYPFLQTAVWETFCEYVQQASYAKGHVLLKGGQVAQSMYLLVEGAVKISKQSQQGQEMVHGFVFEHSFFTDYGSFFRRLPAETDMVLLENSSLLVLGFADCEAMCSQLPAWKDFTWQLVLDNMQYQRQKETLMRLGNPLLVYRALLDKMPYLFQRVGQKDIAAYMGVAPETFSRMKRKLMAVPPNSI